METTKALIIDNGTATIKAGRDGNDRPECEIPNLVAHLILNEINLCQG